MKVSDYVIQSLLLSGVDHAFCVTGGSAAHLMESLRVSDFDVVHNHHEQACAMAADGYTRVSGKPALVLVTNGPGVSNAITGVLGAYQDSIPMVVISGQVQTRQMIINSGTALRQFGVQEMDIGVALTGICKYTSTITSALEVREILGDAINIALSGRKGPVWIEIPLDVQASQIDDQPKCLVVDDLTDSLKSATIRDGVEIFRKVLNDAKKPLVILGAGVRQADCINEIRKFNELFGIPTVCTWGATDLFDYYDPQYVGNLGILGERIANAAVQSSDFLIILGSRLSIPCIGYATSLFAPNSKKLMVDIDSNELHKSSLSIDIPINVDLKEFLTCVISPNLPLVTNVKFGVWGTKIQHWKKELSILCESNVTSEKGVNAYNFIERLSTSLKYGDIVVTDMGTSFTCTMQALRNSGGNRLFTASGLSPMGYGLPGAIGASRADDQARVICICGDGGIQMNIQELQTIVHYKIPIKVFVLNSDGYLAISIMQDNSFAAAHFGSTRDSGVSAPSFSRIAEAYGIHSAFIDSTENFDSFDIDGFLNHDGPALCEIVIPSDQLMLPRVQSLRSPTGGFVSGSIDEMHPPLDPQIFQQLKSDLYG